MYENIQTEQFWSALGLGYHEQRLALGYQGTSCIMHYSLRVMYYVLCIMHYAFYIISLKSVVDQSNSNIH